LEVLEPRVRRLAAAAATAAGLAFAALLVGGCESDDNENRGALNAGAGVRDERERAAHQLEAYTYDAALRRRALEASIVNAENAYSQRRLLNYQDTSGWGVLPELNPPTTPIVPADVERSAPSADAKWTKADVDALTTFSPADLHKLGEYAFYNYPVQPVSSLPTALKRPNRAGIWEHDGRLGAVWVNLTGGISAALTCASCHASVDAATPTTASVLVSGRNNPLIEAGVIMAGDGERGPPSWTPGKVDVTEDTIDDPITISDLRPIRYQQNLHHAATLRNNEVALAVRIETLIITSHSTSIRPPRKVVAALTAFLLDLAPTKPLPSADTPGAKLFEADCANCHSGEGRSGPPIQLSVVATDPLVGQSPDRGTGTYRVPSLRSVGDRHRLFASGSIEDINDLLTPSEERSKKGHTYGLSLSVTNRALLLDYLRNL
jgi:hypothetical protein